LDKNPIGSTLKMMLGVIIGGKGLIVIAVITLVVVFILIIASLLGGDMSSKLEAQTISTYYPSCEEGEFDEEAFRSIFTEAGELSELEGYIHTMAISNSLDPVLFGAILLHESNFGTSDNIMNKKNPMNLKDENDNVIEYETIEIGIEKSAEYLYENFISEEIVSISGIGEEFAPVDSEENPSNSNTHWVSSVNDIAVSLGGLTLYCDLLAGELIYPIVVDNIEPYISSPFGKRVDPFTEVVSYHNGQDFAFGKGTPIVASGNGKVIEVVSNCILESLNDGCGGGFGNHVTIDHGDFITISAHMSRTHVSVGDVVTVGQVVGEVGSTGRSTGPHLHFEVRVDGQPQNPMDFFAKKDTESEDQ
jgi:murein DD-endopeptidase MepM/ murein hydrolase activator NlpD